MSHEAARARRNERLRRHDAVVGPAQRPRGARTDQRARNPQREKLARIDPAARAAPGPEPMGRPDAQQELPKLAAAGAFRRLRGALRVPARKESKSARSAAFPPLYLPKR